MTFYDNGDYWDVTYNQMEIRQVRCSTIYLQAAELLEHSMECCQCHITLYTFRTGCSNSGFIER